MGAFFVFCAEKIDCRQNICQALYLSPVISIRFRPAAISSIFGIESFVAGTELRSRTFVPEVFGDERDKSDKTRPGLSLLSLSCRSRVVQPKPLRRTGLMRFVPLVPQCIKKYLN